MKLPHCAYFFNFSRFFSLTTPLFQIIETFILRLCQVTVGHSGIIGSNDQAFLCVRHIFIFTYISPMDLFVSSTETFPANDILKAQESRVFYMFIQQKYTLKNSVFLSSSSTIKILHQEH